MGDNVASSKSMPWDDLSGKIVMVTGASSGLGREFSLDLARAGCKIIAAARRVDRLISLCDEINKLQLTCSTTNSCNGEPAVSIRAVALELDVTAKGPVIEASVKRAWEAFGRIDVLINNAGVRGSVLSSLELPEEEWNNTMRTNLTGTWLVSKYVCSYMRDLCQGGSIINISSVSGLGRAESPGALAYATSKAGVNTLTKVMALEMGPFNIKVNCICPGVFKSEVTENLLKASWVNKVVERVVPLRTLGTTDPALTQLIRFLIHDSSNYINGNLFIVDAGATLPGIPLFSSL